MEQNILLGKWKIIEMPDFDDEFMHAEENAYLKISDTGSEFKFGYVNGYFHLKQESKLKKGGVIKFYWEGSDEIDEVSGTGWIKIISDKKIEGEIHFFDSDTYKFIAKK